MAKIKNGNSFIVIDQGKIQEFKSLGNYTHQDRLFYIYEDKNQIKNISEALVYKTTQQATRAYIKQIKETIALYKKELARVKDKGLTTKNG